MGTQLHLRIDAKVQAEYREIDEYDTGKDDPRDNDPQDTGPRSCACPGANAIARACCRPRGCLWRCSAGTRPGNRSRDS